MPKKRYNAEEIIHKLREADVLLAQGSKITETCKQLGVTDQTYYRWRKEYGGMKVDQAKRLKELEAENARLKHPNRPAFFTASGVLERLSGKLELEKTC